ncbi:hypothetical protein J7F02_33920, partial [Streptomyces sp. ISL-112]|uniref:hypothetical protein n=1 Tax=unclassified Streptomyces TaxID=2593676 RepID=UPI001BE78B10
MSLFIVDKANTSLAWQEACLKLDVPGKPKRDALHTVVHIANAAAENPQIREEFDQMRKERGYAPIETVANTLFPAELAAVSRTPEELVRRYRSMYPRLRRIDPGNKTGTYFGRIVAYPGEKGPVDQLTALINRIRRQAAGKGPMTAAYEMGVDHPDDRPASDLPGGDHADYADTGTWSAPVHAAGKDNGLRGFPCLSHCEPFRVG